MKLIKPPRPQSLRVGANDYSPLLFAIIVSLQFTGSFCVILAAAVGVVWAQAGRSAYKFDFGPGKIAPGYIQVLSTDQYSPERGYGFEDVSPVNCLDRGTPDALRGDFCSGERPFLFSVKLPEGTYQVTVTLGDHAGESTTTVKAELRRLMLEKVHTAPGKFVTRTFMVNIRTPKIPSGGEVRLKDREKTTESAAWDDKLTLEFNDARPCVNALEIVPVDKVATVYLLGDSTVCDQPLEPYNSWGQMLPRFFKAGVVVANHAESGESLRSSLAARRLDKVLSTMKAGDYLFIQYGHNDMKEKGEGIGAFTSYKTDLKRFVSEARKCGGIPVLVTSMNRRTFDADGKITNSFWDYPEAVRQVAREDKVPLIDLFAMSKLFYEALGPELSLKAFAPNDGTHHNNYGSYELARCVVEGIKAGKLGIAKYLASDVRPFNPAHPDLIDTFRVPPSLQKTTTKPAGN
jgi:lysophospholipase L1-like esterase